VIASLLVVAREISKNTAHSKQANWGWLVDRFNAIYAQTNNVEFADLLARGQKSFVSLTEGEKISYGYFLELLCIAHEGLFIYVKDEVHGHEEMTRLFEKHLRFHLGFPGGREWWKQFQADRGLPERFTQEINRVLGQEPLGAA
jgi:hypothetical protein